MTTINESSAVVASGALTPRVPSERHAASERSRWINSGWRFLRVDGVEPTGFNAPDFVDSSWEQVNLPHTPRIESYNQPSPWQGICYYRKGIAPEATWRGKHVTVQFGAAMQIADVFVNGRHILTHLGGYLPFTIDLTKEAQAGTPIEIAVRLDNRDTNIVPPGKETKGLDFNYPGGLYRGVELTVTNAVHISDAVEANIVAGESWRYRQSTIQPFRYRRKSASGTEKEEVAGLRRRRGDAGMAWLLLGRREAFAKSRKT